MAGIDSFTKLMLHMEGPNLSTTFTDSSLNPKTGTAAAGALISTSQTTLGGTSSGFFAGTLNPAAPSEVTFPDSADWNFGSSDFTIDFRIYWIAKPSINGQYEGIITQYESGAKQFYLAINLIAGVTHFDWSIIGGAGGNVTYDAQPTINNSQWYHIAIIRSGNNFMLFVDGVQVGTTVTAAITCPDVAGVLEIGGYPAAQGVGSHSGYMKEVRVSNGIARWTGPFTPSTSPYSIAGSGRGGKSIPPVTDYWSW